MVGSLSPESTTSTQWLWPQWILVLCNDWLRVGSPNILKSRFCSCQEPADWWTSVHELHLQFTPCKPAFDENSEIKPAPCDLCGMWSKAFCEGCDTSSQAPTGVCSICDRDHLVCWKCVNNNRSWEVAVAERASIHSGEHIEVSGFEDDQGVWTPLRPAIRVATADLNVQMDGSFDMQQLTLRIREELHKREQ